MTASTPPTLAHCGGCRWAVRCRGGSPTPAPLSVPVMHLCLYSGSTFSTICLSWVPALPAGPLSSPGMARTRAVSAGSVWQSCADTFAGGRPVHSSCGASRGSRHLVSRLHRWRTGRAGWRSARPSLAGGGLGRRSRCFAAGAAHGRRGPQGRRLPSHRWKHASLCMPRPSRACASSQHRCVGSPGPNQRLMAEQDGEAHPAAAARIVCSGRLRLRPGARRAIGAGDARGV